MADEHPPHDRRASDEDRRRWGDQALDLLNDRVGDIEDQLIERVTAVKETAERIERRYEEGTKALHRRLDRMTDQIDKRFDAVDKAHAAAAARPQVIVEPRRGVDWKTVMAVVSAITVPLLIPIIYLVAHQP